MSGFADPIARNAERRMLPFISIDKDILAISRARSALFCFPVWESKLERRQRLDSGDCEKSIT